MADESLHNLGGQRDLHLADSKSIIIPVLSGAAWTFRITDPPGTQVVGRAAAGSLTLRFPFLLHPFSHSRLQMAAR